MLIKYGHNGTSILISLKDSTKEKCVIDKYISFKKKKTFEAARN